jgi:hypothetical protein
MKLDAQELMGMYNDMLMTPDAAKRHELQNRLLRLMPKMLFAYEENDRLRALVAELIPWIKEFPDCSTHKMELIRRAEAEAGK